ncbi:M23/M56 family metallopeptidase [Croceitalea rosinachiae]|uniref:M23/M56 family metallopeptidase n=1 Tax=Croceitalea rosinachiae TaxID=3075596 RepID=A0ABU3AD89_9FLAO|nr:M23/M56 family metallopeptidase [Croceitalea sp. F388]MDT0608151.1 M23/M56 family metallopeptidase [Croceitalea sp. F388]
MEAFFVHLLKSSGIILLFLGIYQVFLKKETFFKSNRLFLVIGLLISLLLPFVTITQTTYVERAPMFLTDLSSFTMVTETSNESLALFNWLGLLLIIYILGTVYFGLRLIVQLYSIRTIRKKSEVVIEDSFYHVKTNDYISPFSFFKHIFYYPKQFSKNELNTIISHEKVHAKELHSIDILLTEVLCIFQWFNPAIWFYKSSIKQNLEFLADSKTCQEYEDKKQYQYLMLKQIVGSHKITIANPFFNSLIKKRIIMLNRNQSKRINALKLLVILPLLFLFLVGFNTKEVVKFRENAKVKSIEKPFDVEFINPLNQSDIQKISLGFGPAKSPFTNEMEFHQGIDLVASTGKDVKASANGTVKVSSLGFNNGNYILLEHENGYLTKYMHLNDRVAKVGDQVKSGDVIGHVGNTGKSTGPHLHFEISKSGKSLNPESLIPFKSLKKAIETKKPPAKKSVKTYKKIELLITKSTSNEKLEEIKKDLATDDIDFSYTVVHNDKDEIIQIDVNVSGKGKNGEKFNSSYSSSDSENGITPLVIFIDHENNLVSIGSKGAYNPNIALISSEKDKVWISNSNNDKETIEIRTEGGVKKILVDGKEVHEDEEIHSNHFSFNTDDDDHDVRVKVISSEGKKKHKDKKGVFILKDADNDLDIEVIDENDGFFFINADGEEEPLFYIDGKEASRKEVKKLSPKEIKTIDVSKGKAAKKKYGKKAKNGAVEITTKKKN